MSAVRSIDPSARFRDDIASVLRAALERAERGELRSVIVLGSTATGYDATRAGDADYAREVGMLEMAKHTLVHRAQGGG